MHDAFFFVPLIFKVSTCIPNLRCVSITVYPAFEKSRRMINSTLCVQVLCMFETKLWSSLIKLDPCGARPLNLWQQSPSILCSAKDFILVINNVKLGFRWKDERIQTSNCIDLARFQDTSRVEEGQPHLSPCQWLYGMEVSGSNQWRLTLESNANVAYPDFRASQQRLWWL